MNDLRFIALCSAIAVSISTACGLAAGPSSVSVESGQSADEAHATENVALPSRLGARTTIDFLIESAWVRDRVQPSSRSSDRVFARRLYLDLAGRIPTVAELNRFLAETESDKRERLVDRLIASPEFGRNLADVFDVVLMGRGSARRMAQRQQHGWRDYLEESFNANRPWNMMTRDMALARKAENADVRAGWFLYERDNDHQAVAETVSPAFFGIRIECAQCHDHPLADEIAQGHYWGLVSFFQRSKNQKTDAGVRVAESAEGAFNKFTNLDGDSFDTELTYYASAVVPEARPANDDKNSDVDDSSLYLVSADDEPRVPRFSRREKFVDHVLLTHPMLAKAYVNRIWALFVGRGFVHPVDRMDSTHEPSHPQLLDWLARDFEASSFDTKRLVRHIVLSRAYQLAGATDYQIQPETFSHGIEKPLTAEALLRSIYVAMSGEALPEAELLAAFREKFGDVFAEEPSSNVTQALYLTNNPRFNTFLQESPLVQRLREQPDPARITTLAFETILGRLPDDDELAMTTSFLESSGEPDTTDVHTARIVSLAWALITSAEFRFNH